MRMLKTALASALVVATLAVPVIASAHPHHPYCKWVVRHHHRVKVCR